MLSKLWKSLCFVLLHHPHTSQYHSPFNVSRLTRSSYSYLYNLLVNQFTWQRQRDYKQGYQLLRCTSQASSLHCRKVNREPLLCPQYKAPSLLRTSNGTQFPSSASSISDLRTPPTSSAKCSLAQMQWQNRIQQQSYQLCWCKHSLR